MEEELQNLATEIETLNLNPQALISKPTLSHLQTLIISNPNFSQTLNPQTLISPLNNAMDSNSNISLIASNTYLSLILSPNAPVFSLFTPMAFLSLLRSIRTSLKNLKSSNFSGSSGKIAKNKKKVRFRNFDENDEIAKNSKSSRFSDFGLEDENVENDENESDLVLRNKKNRKGKKTIENDENLENVEKDDFFDIRVLFVVLEKLELVLGLIHLDRFLDSLKSLIQTVCEMPVLGVELCGSDANYRKLCDLCFRILVNVLGPEHGDQLVTSSEILRMLCPVIFRVKCPSRAFALGFVVKMIGMSRNSSEIKKGVVNMPKYLAIRAPEKAEPRGLAVESIVEIVKSLDFEDQVEFTVFVVKMSMGKSSLRLLSVDLVLNLMMILSDPLGLSFEERDESYWGLRCLQALVDRCSDSIAGIRARALTNLANLVGFLSGNERNRVVLKEVLGFGDTDKMDELLRKRCADEKAAVRKASLLLISKLTAVLGGTFDEVVLKTMGMACSDPLVSIRKAAMSALSEAFRNFSDGSVTKEWLHSVPRLIGDNETSIQEECENVFLELVLDRLSRVGSTNLSHNNMEPDSTLIHLEGVLGILKEICHSDVAPWVKKICSSLGKKGKLKSRIATALQNIIRVSESVWSNQSKPIEMWTAPPGAWLLLSEVSFYLPKAVDWEFLRHHWQLLDKNARTAEVDATPFRQELEEEELETTDSNPIAWAMDRVFLLQTISNVSVELPPEPAADLASNLLKRIEDFNMNTTEVNAHVKTLRTLCKRKASCPEECDALVTKWVNQLLTNASEVLDRYMSNDEKSKKDATFLTPPSNRSRKGKKAALSMSILLSKATTAVYTIGSLVIVCPSADLKAVVPVLHTIITSANTDPKLTKLAGPVDSIKQTAPSLYIQAWLTMGKICLADGKLAKRYIPLFVQELEKSDCAALRNNIIVMMADFCVHYTALVDCYISRITKCLRDPYEVVRRQTFILLSRLLQRDYVKWRGVLFLRFLLSLVDESEKIKHLADYLFGNILKVKSPLLAYNSFVEAIFVLNDCNAAKGQGNNSKSSKAENRLFSIRGNDEESRSKRMHIYTSLLKQMAPEHLLATFAKVCAEVLASATDGMLNIDDSAGKSVLQDAFQILACKEIRIPSTRGSSSDLGDVDDEGGDGGGAAAAAARGKVITQAVKKGLIQNTIPIFIELKRLLESKNSTLQGSLMECLRNILKEYKNEIDEILVADKQLQKELIYDMQKYESQKPNSASANEASTSQRPNSFVSPNERNGQKTIPQNLSKLRHAPTPPLSAMSVPKLKSAMNGRSGTDRPAVVLESLRRKCFDSDEEN